MKVRELLDALEGFDHEANVVIWTNDDMNSVATLQQVAGFQPSAGYVHGEPPFIDHYAPAEANSDATLVVLV